ncbi:MAG: DUF4835 family protein [Bacteroidales bacterium]|nr:DUF4835 family protein [Bacteroidales bacterium]
MLKIFLAFILTTASVNIFAQEFNATIQVSSRQIEGTDKKVFETLQSSLYEFINDRIWTNYSFKIEERIECTFVLNITERVSSDIFKATLNVVSRRPIYKTSYNSVMFNFIDKDFEFEYVEFQPMDYSDNTFTSNLTSVFAYYLYIILGLDFDSFSPMGGTPFFEKAEAIVNAAQNTPEKGWKSFDSQKNRYWLVENYLNSSYTSLRKCIYEYHRKGLDIMSEKVEIGRGNISESLKLLQKVFKERPGLFILQLFLDAKRDEIINVFSEGSPMEKSNAVNICKEIDPANSSNYQKILSKS